MFYILRKSDIKDVDERKKYRKQSTCETSIQLWTTYLEKLLLVTVEQVFTFL